MPDSLILRLYGGEMDLTELDMDRSGVVGEPPKDAARPQSSRTPRGSKFKAGFYLFTALLSGWVFAYGSGLAPWLGVARVDETTAPFTRMRAGNLYLGLNTMLLFKGQTAFYEYDSSDPHGEITFDVKPFTTLGYSPAMVRVNGARQGRLEFPITRTGVYRFQHEPALGRRYGRTAYTVNWGAK